MNSLSRHVIKLVQDTVREYSSSDIPNFEEICFGLELDVKVGFFRSGTDGMQSEKTIILNSRIENKERNLFTAFHEVMHYLLKKDGYLISELHDLIFHNKDEFDRQIEIYCNIGAAEFLMPREKFRKLYEEKGLNVELILYAANYFKSSTIAATIQLAQIAPNQCITAVCELTSNNTTPSQTNLFNQKYRADKRRLHVVYSAFSPTAKYPLAKNTAIPYDHLIHDAFGQDNPVEGKSYVPFRSGKKMPCHCEALADGNRVYVIFHLSTPPPVDHKQMTLFSLF